MLEEADRFYLKAKDFHTDLAEALGIICDYQRDLNLLRAADKNRERTTPLMEKYEAKQVPAEHNNWPGRYGTFQLTGITS